MQSWINFLEQQGARFATPPSLAIEVFADGPNADAPPFTNFMAPLTEYGLIAATGADAASFLHNQLTNDVEKLDAAQARLAGYCTPKGRLMATFLVWKSGESILLQLPSALLPALQKRLSMFILRAKAKLNDASTQQVQIGLAGPAAVTILQQWFNDMPAKPYAVVHAAAGTLMRLADTASIDDARAAGVARYLWITDEGSAQAAWPQLRAVLQPAGADAWYLSDIRAGVPVITGPTQEQFVPQMINFEAVGGVNFQKGCYPGQEIVARSQYLGKLKRRMMPATVASATVAAGSEVFSSADPTQACGMVVNAAPNAPGSSACLVEIKLAALDASVHLDTIDGPMLTFHALPYALSDADRPDLR